MVETCLLIFLEIGIMRRIICDAHNYNILYRTRKFEHINNTVRILIQISHVLNYLEEKSIMLSYRK